MAVTGVGYFFSYLTDKHQPNTSEILLDCKGYYNCHCLSSSHHRLLNLPSMQCTTCCWQSVGLALTGSSRKKHSIYSSSVSLHHLYVSYVYHLCYMSYLFHAWWLSF